MQKTIIAIIIFISCACSDGNKTKSLINDLSSEGINSDVSAMPLNDMIDTIKLADVVFKNKVIDFGKVSKGDTIKATYEFENVSNNDLIIDYVNPDCICTSHELSNSIITPKSKGFITLVFNTNNKIGYQKLYAVVKANTEAKFYRLMLKAEVNND